MSDLALPPHLRSRLHNDWIWPLNKISRGWNAYGPRASKDAKDYRAWPPRLVEGKGVARWELCGATSIIMIPEFVNATIRGADVYGKEWDAIDMTPGSATFQKQIKVFIPAWQPATVFDIRNNNGTHTQVCQWPQYSPSALQKFSPKGWMKLNPDYHSEWRILKKRELPVYPEAGEDTVLFFRRGYRPDHVDIYYNKSLVGTAGLHWE